MIRGTESEKLLERSKLMNLISDGEINEIMINSHEQIFYEKCGVIRKAPKLFEDTNDYNRFINQLLSENNITVNESRPIVEFNIGKELRVSLVKDSISHRETVITIRRRRNFLLSTERLIKAGLCNETVMNYLRDSVKKKMNIFISGQTSSGKTTLMNALIREIDASERLVIIEDTPEISISPDHNAVSLISRQQRYESQAVSISDLIKASLRMRPDRIILGEVRREEVVQFIHALNTGHSGSICTGHSQSNQDMFNRLLMLLIESGIPIEAAKFQLGRSVDLMVHLDKNRGKRSIDEIEKVIVKGTSIQFEKIISINKRGLDYVWHNNQDGH